MVKVDEGILAQRGGGKLLIPSSITGSRGTGL